MLKYAHSLCAANNITTNKMITLSLMDLMLFANSTLGTHFCQQRTFVKYDILA